MCPWRKTPSRPWPWSRTSSTRRHPGWPTSPRHGSSPHSRARAASELATQGAGDEPRDGPHLLAVALVVEGPGEVARHLAQRLQGIARRLAGVLHQVPQGAVLLLLGRGLLLPTIGLQPVGDGRGQVFHRTTRVVVRLVQVLQPLARLALLLAWRTGALDEHLGRDHLSTVAIHPDRCLGGHFLAGNAHGLRSSIP